MGVLIKPECTRSLVYKKLKRGRKKALGVCVRIIKTQQPTKRRINNSTKRICNFLLAFHINVACFCLPQRNLTIVICTPVINCTIAQYPIANIRDGSFFPEGNVLTWPGCIKIVHIYVNFSTLHLLSAWQANFYPTHLFRFQRRRVLG